MMNTINPFGDNSDSTTQQALQMKSNDFNLGLIGMSFDTLSPTLSPTPFLPISIDSESLLTPTSNIDDSLSVFESMLSGLSNEDSSDPSDDLESVPGSPESQPANSDIPPFHTAGKSNGSSAGKSSNRTSSSTSNSKSNKREPLPEDYDDEETFNSVWTKWRDDRDHNNRSVKRSRQRAKLRKLEALKATQASSRGKKEESSSNSELEAYKIELQLLVRMIKKRTLTSTEVKRANNVIERYDDPTASVANPKRRSTKSH